MPSCLEFRIDFVNVNVSKYIEQFDSQLIYRVLCNETDKLREFEKLFQAKKLHKL